MRASNNSDVQVCIDNLLKIVKGEVPYSREKGIKRNIVDLPSDAAKLQIVMSANECIDNYEPRVDVRRVRPQSIDEDGNLSYTIMAEPRRQ